MPIKGVWDNILTWNGLNYFIYFTTLYTIISAGIKRPVTEEDKDWTRQSLLQLGRFTGMGWLLSPETPQVGFGTWIWLSVKSSHHTLNNYVQLCNLNLNWHNRGYAHYIIIIPGGYAGMPTEWRKKNTFPDLTAHTSNRKVLSDLIKQR